MNTVAGKLRTTSQIALGAHFFLTLTSITYGAGILNSSNGTGEGDIAIAKKKEVYDAHHYSKVTDWVSAFYSGNVKRTSRKPLSTVVALDENATFEDPVAICVRRVEVQEAFRALCFVHPQSVTEPKCVDVNPKGRSIELTYSLHQNYSFGSLFDLQVRSLLMIEVQLERIIENDLVESKFVITRMEERWNGAKPFESTLFWIVRRINGFMSYHLTSRLLSEN